MQSLDSTRPWTLALSSLAVVALALAGFGALVAHVEQRPGSVLRDPVLAWFAPRDLSTPSFVAIYGSLALALAVLARRPRRLTLALNAYTLMLGLRALLMAVTPLAPPTTIVPLRDPLVEGLGGSGALTHDLFFSGHVATGLVLAGACPRGWARWLLVALSSLVGVLMLLQHAHYTVDVLVAPLAAFAALDVAGRLPWNAGAAGPG